jgi:hypothetical protein
MCKFKDAKLGDRVDYYSECACKVCNADNSRHIYGTYLCHQEGYDVVAFDTEYTCPNCGNVHTQMFIPCNKNTHLALTALFYGKSKQPTFANS